MRKCVWFSCSAFVLAACLVRVGIADESTVTVPDSPLFSRHVVAVFSKLGCNGGTCHGAVQGKNGFRLSLFGAKPADDFEQVARGAERRRIDLLDAEKSLLLLKATAQIPHGGGRVTRLGSPEYEVLKRWIAGGA